MKASNPEIEQEYVNAMKEYDLATVNFNFAKRDIRRRRQYLADKSRQLAERQRRIEKLKAKFNKQDDGQILRQQQQIQILQNELHKTISRLKKEKAKLEPFKRGYGTGLQDQDYLIASMKQKERELRATRESLDSRHHQAKRILSEPLDDIRMDEMLISDTEQDVEMAEAKMSTLEENDDSEDLRSAWDDIEELEERNRDRKKELTRIRAQMITERQNLKEKRPFKVKKLSSPKRKPLAKIADVVDKNHINNFIDEMFQSFIARQKKINKEEQEIDIMEATNQQRRRESEDDWNQKVTKIKQMTMLLRANEQMRMSISELRENIENESHNFHVLISEKEKIKRRISNILRDKDYNSQKNAEHRKLVEANNAKARACEARDVRIKDRRRAITEYTAKVEALQDEVEAYDRKVQSVEDDGKKLEAKNNELITELQETMAQCEASRLIYIENAKPSGDLFDQSLLSSINA